MYLLIERKVLFILVFAAQYSIQMQFGQLILHFLCSKRRSHHLSAILLLLASNTHIMADFTSNEEFTIRVLAYTQALTVDPTKVPDVWKVWKVFCNLFRFGMLSLNPRKVF